MDGRTLQDRLYRAAGRTAALIGAPCDLYRPNGPDSPLAPSNRILRLPAVFIPVGGRLNRAVQQSEPMWECLLDAVYAKPGDILCRRTDNAIFFIVATQPLLPVLCVRALRTVSFTRPAAPSVAGLNVYGGVVTQTNTPLAAEWPASILVGTGSATALASIEGELSPSAWQVLLPPSLDVSLRIDDRLTTDLGQIGVIANAERTDLGWRLIVKPATT